MPLSKKIFDDLISLFQTVNNCLANSTGRVNSTTKKRNSSLEEAALASFIQVKRRHTKTNEGLKESGTKRITSVKDYTKILTYENAYRDIYHIFHERMDYFVKIYCPK